MNSLNAKSIKSINTSLEILFDKALKIQGLSYTKNDNSVFGKPDFCFKNEKIAVFCDSEFWHGKKMQEGEKFKTNKEFWESKIQKNINRDKKVTEKLEADGWKVMRFWGKDIEKNLENCVNLVKLELSKSSEKTEKPKNKIYKTIDLFAGIGGIRLGFEQTNRVKNVFSAEIDKYACQTYETNFGENPYCDITQLNEKKLPDFDILLAGFPCQAFSIAGRRGGFDDVRGTLFFDVARILKQKRPKAFLLENVKGLTNHDKGKTFQTIMNILENELEYIVHYAVLNSKDYGIPQKRERIYIVGFLKDINFKFPKKKNIKKTIKDIMENSEVSSKYYLSDTYLNTLKRHRQRHEEKGNGFGFEILSCNDIANTLVVGGMGKERNLVCDNRLTDFAPKTNIKGEINKEFIRKMTPREWARIQGYPDDFKIPVSDAQAYKQFGNSVSVPVIYEIAKLIIQGLDNE